MTDSFENLTPYRVVRRSELTDAHYAAAPHMIDRDDRWGDHAYDSYVFRYEGNHPVECLGSDGGEPEDQTLGRDWSWVAPALNAAYVRGRAAQ